MPSQTTAAGNANYRWVILIIVYLSFLAFAIVFQSIPPILSLLISDLNLSHGEAGLLMSLFALPGVLLSIPVGILADRYGPKNLMILCLLLMILGSLLVASGSSFAVLAVGRIIAGAGGLSLFVVGAQLISQWFAGRELGTAVGVYSTAMPVGTIISLNTLGAFAGAAGWQGSILLSAGLCAVALVMFVVLYQPASATPAHRPEQPKASVFSTLFDVGLPVWLVGFIWMLFNAAVIAFLTFAPDFFVAEGYGIGFAGLLASLLMLLALPFAPLLGYVLDRFDHEELFIGVGGLLVAVSIAAVPSANSLLIPFLLVLSLGNAVVPTPVFALPPKLLKPGLLGTGYGIVSTCLNAGIVVGPYACGLVIDWTGSFQSSFYLMSFFALLVTVVAVVLRLLRKPIRVGKPAL